MLYLHNFDSHFKKRLQWVTGALSPGVKRPGHLLLLKRSRIMELYFHSPIRLHDVLLN
jgi:hypothetical protein